ncbi:MAG: alpha-galactosidase [Planctomycetota bacterium]
MSKQTAVRIAYIGGGSRGWAQDLFCDLALHEALHGQIVLYDIDHPAAVANVARGEQVFTHPDARARFDLEVASELDAALEGADIVVISIEPGPIEAREADLVVPERYGILQAVGDTTGPGGILRAIRSCAPFVEFAEAIRRCCPAAWVFNYSNPMTLCTALLHAVFPGIKAVGCCHEVFGLQTWFQRRIPRWFDAPEPARNAVRLDVIGVNHFTWATAARWCGHDLMPLLAAEIDRRGYFDQLDRSGEEELDLSTSEGPNRFIGLDLFRRFGVPGAAGDAHLVEFVPWYCDSDASLQRLGVRRKTYARRLEMHAQKLQQPPVDHASPLKHSCEEGVETMAALIGREDFFTNVNVPNTGQMPWLPQGAVVEGNALVRADELVPTVPAPPPLPVQSLIRRVVDVQQAVLAGLLAEDNAAIEAALLCDPLVVRLRPDQVHRMWREMRAANAQWLPAWARC